jgi:hypothetical protein
LTQGIYIFDWSQRLSRAVAVFDNFIVPPSAG